ncbi:MAG: XRE family transcriptional regulator, partial [Myxococcota bacterium]
NLESGGANPTLQVMMRIAGALHVSLEELIRAPRAGCVLYPAGSLPTRKRGGALIRDLLPDTIVGIHIERLELASHASLTGVPHRVGTREYLVCDSGRIELVAGGESFALAPGDVLAFRGDQRHSYRNPRAAKAVAYSVIAAAPV